MDAAHLMTPDVTYVDEETPITVAWSLMQKLGVRHLPVVEQGKLVGIVSDRDLLERAARTIEGGLCFPDLCAAEVMKFHPVSSRPDASAAELAATMIAQRVDSIPVVSPEGALLGLVTSVDLLRLVARPAR